MWSDEQEAKLRELAACDLSAGRIAIELGVSRGAVIGKMNRLKIPLFHRQGVRCEPRIKQPQKRRARGPDKLTSMMWNNKPPQRLLPFKSEVRTDIASPRVGLLDLQFFHCRWPLDERGPDGFTVFCGAPKCEGSYCKAHARMAYRTLAQLRSDAIAEREAREAA